MRGVPGRRLFVLGRGVLTHMGTGKGKLVIKGEDGQSPNRIRGLHKVRSCADASVRYGCKESCRLTIRLGHPVFPYLPASERRPTRSPAPAADGTFESEGARRESALTDPGSRSVHRQCLRAPAIWLRPKGRWRERLHVKPRWSDLPAPWSSPDLSSSDLLQVLSAHLRHGSAQSWKGRQ